jgi:hypothetical protein
MGINVKNYEKFHNMLKCAKTENFDASKIITQMKKED